MRTLELHARFKIVQRSKGQSAVAAAAYRSASRLYDERTGQWKDYSHKTGVEHSALLLPDNAPAWAHERSQLWNAAEKKENRKNSQIARELEINFPHEMNAEQRRRAGYEVAQVLVERYGAAVDIAFHKPSREGDQRNHHAHILFSVRAFDSDQADRWAKNKYRALSDRTKDRNGHTRATAEILHLRERTAGIMNDIGAEHGLGVYVEHLSFEQRGLDREASIHLGPDITALERGGTATELGKKNRAIRAENERRARLEAEKNIIDLAAERERRRMTTQALDAARETEMRATAAQRREALYAQVQAQRTAMLEAQRARFGEREAALRSELAALHRSADRSGWFGFVRFWHQVSGQRRADLERIEALQGEYDRLQAQKVMETQAFEQRRVAKLEALKRQEIAQERERAEAVRVKDYQHKEARSIEPRQQGAYRERFAELASKRERQGERNKGREETPASNERRRQQAGHGAEPSQVEQQKTRIQERLAARRRARQKGRGRGFEP